MTVINSTIRCNVCKKEIVSTHIPYEGWIRMFVWVQSITDPKLKELDFCSRACLGNSLYTILKDISNV